MNTVGALGPEIKNMQNKFKMLSFYVTEQSSIFRSPKLDLTAILVLKTLSEITLLYNFTPTNMGKLTFMI